LLQKQGNDQSLQHARALLEVARNIEAKAICGQIVDLETIKQLLNVNLTLIDSVEIVNRDFENLILQFVKFQVSSPTKNKN
jgi:hypothetical protein